MSDYSPNAGLLNDRCILVTGAAQGIGRAVAKACAKFGATVLALDVKRRKLETLYDEILAEQYPEPILIPMDLNKSKPEAFESVAAGIQHDVEKLDGIAHIAGMLPGLNALQSHNLDAWYNILQVNLTAPYLLTRACLPLLKLSKDASVVFTSAECGRKGQAYWGAYGVAYGGIEKLCETWADELEVNSNIRFNTLDPGPVHTNMRMKTFPGEAKNDLLQPEDVVSSYLYLLGPESININGHSLSAQPAHDSHFRNLNQQTQSH